MIVKLLAEHHLEFLSLKGGCRGSSESTHVKMSHCWKSHALAHYCSWLTVISVRCKNCSYNNIGKGIRRLDKIAMIFVHAGNISCKRPP